jgi:hypothetical protein
MGWINEELATLSLGDRRLRKRAKMVLTQLSHNPTDSIPVACNGAAETKAAYRFFEHPEVAPEKIHKAHFDATFERMKQQRIVLIPQDTTVLNFSNQRGRKDAGPTTKETTKGIHLHCALALTPEKVCLGVTSVKQWYREALQKLTRRERTVKNLSTPIEAKESFRWLENYKAANEYARLLPTTKVVSIADREGDIYDIYQEANKVFVDKATKAHFLIRAKCDRRIANQEGLRTDNKIKSTLKSENPLGKLVINITDTPNRKARQATMTIYAKTVRIALPDKQKKEKDYNPIEVTAILCVENHPSDGAKPLEWLLITDLTVNSFEEACEKIRWYTCRWQIEIFFKVLKSGCQIEKLQLTDKNFRTCLSIYIIIAWRTLHLVMVGRQSLDHSCESILSKDEWQTTYVIVKRKKPPKIPPNLNEMLRLVATLGGYLNRKSDPPPGVKAMWIGIRNMQEHLKAKEALVYGKTYG